MLEHFLEMMKKTTAAQTADAVAPTRLASSGCKPIASKLNFNYRERRPHLRRIKQGSAIGEATSYAMPACL